MGETRDFPEPREPGPDRRDNVASAGLDPDTWAELEKWRTDRRLKRSEATRRLLRAGLDRERRDTVAARAAVSVSLATLMGLTTVLGASGHLIQAAVLTTFTPLTLLLYPWLSDGLSVIREEATTLLK